MESRALVALHYFLPFFLLSSPVALISGQQVEDIKGITGDILRDVLEYFKEVVTLGRMQELFEERKG